jgi:hypothetical protein
MSGRRGYSRNVPKVGTIRGNKYAGVCHVCGGDVAANSGIVVLGSNGRWQVRHEPAKWHGSPVSGGWFGGCPTIGGAA